MEAEMELIGLFQQINKKIGKMMSSILKDENLSMTEIFVLMTVVKKKTSRITELATTIGIPMSTFTGILDRLEQAGFLERSQDPDDRRSILISATMKLSESFRKWRVPVEERMKAAFKTMPQARVNRIVKDLTFMLKSLEQLP